MQVERRDKPAVTLIIPVYNAQRFAASCLDSVLAQTIHEWEAVLVDDGSTDGTEKILADYAARDSRFRVIRQENGGPSAARNHGIREALGTWCLFLDADDRLLPDALEILLGEARDAQVCVGQKIWWNERTGKKVRQRWPQMYGTGKDLKRKLRLYRRSMRGATGRLYLPDLIKEHGIAFDEALHYGEDMVFNYAYFSLAAKIVFTPHPVYVYRTGNPDSLAHRNAPNFIKQWAMERSCIRKTFH